MTRIFEPLLEHAIIYIDDILLFSKDIKTHKVLLNQFFDIANHYGLMFSEKKIHLAQPQIDFLGMHFFQGSYQPQPHITEELLKFPDKSLTIKQIQQFLGIGPDQTRAIQELKRIAQSPPALKIPGEGKRILQTYASDFYWGAVLIEEQGNKKYYCGHVSGQFKEAERHYHTTFKEALAVKNGTKKFDFHLRKYHFEVQMDNSSFPKILEFKNKMPPDPQILRLKDRLSRYDFSVKHIKGKQNLILDFLSRPEKTIQMITSTHSFPIIFMVKPRLSKSHHPRKPRLAKNLYPTKPKLVGWDLQEATLWAIWCKPVEYSIPIALRTKEAYDILMNPDKEDYLF
ncbi:hypothetical protein CR513_54367, partial [Mucuna pruriens]